jgi:DNA-binding beta-propeller fold protein YncE
MKRTTVLTNFAFLACLIGSAHAAPTTETVLDGLDNPSGLAIQPETGHVFVSDSGAGRVIRVADGKAEDVIVGFPQDIYGKGPMYNIGPLGLAFLDQNTLVVGGGGKPDGEEMLRVYKIPAAGQAAINADQMSASYKLPATEEVKGEGNFYALAATDQAVFVTANGDDTKGWVARLQIGSDGKLGGYERFIATKEATEVDAPVAITISPRGEVVVGQMGEITIPEDGLLTFYNAKNGKMLLNLETGLYDITALSYSPKGQLYATDFAWMATEEGGLFQLIATNEGGEQGVNAKKILELDKPSAMAFGTGGELYITVFGTAEEGSDKKPGKLLKVAAGL